MTDSSNINLSEIKDVEALKFLATISDSGKRLDAFLAEKIEGWSRSQLQKLIDDGDVLVNEKVSKSSHKIRPSDEIEVELTEAIVEIFEPEDIPLEIVFEDKFLAVINKPSGLVVHPGAGIPNGTLANAIAFHFKFQLSEDSKYANRVGIVHRLDKDTSGLIVVAKNEEIHEALSAQFRNREVFKSYVALTHGEFDEMNGKIDAPIAREKHNRVKMSVRKHGRNALSLWKVKKRYEKFTLVEVEIKTGRTHQIRVHLSYINYPVVGDELYNAGRDKTVKDVTIRKGIKDLNRFFLHAEKLSFTHPQTNERLNFTAPLPVELTDFLDLL
jgi:23S rRNA pseudouridine1911/1915/1917 synthase